MLARKSVRSGTRARALSPPPPSPGSSSSSSAVPLSPPIGSGSAVSPAPNPQVGAVPSSPVRSSAPISVDSSKDKDPLLPSSDDGVSGGVCGSPPPSRSASFHSAETRSVAPTVSSSPPPASAKASSPVVTPDVPSPPTAARSSGSPSAAVPTASADVPLARLRPRVPTRVSSTSASRPSGTPTRTRPPPTSPPKRVLKRPVASSSRSPPGSLLKKRRFAKSAPSASTNPCSCPAALLATVHSNRFVSSSAATAWPSYSDHPLLVERNICDASFETSGFLPFLSDLGLHRIAHLYQFYWPSLVREFYCNLQSSSSDPSSSWFGKVFVRGHIVDISPAAINSVLGWTTPSFAGVFAVSDVPSKAVLAQTLTGGSLTSWPAVGSLRASSLTVKYFLLFKVLVNTVCPSSNVVKLSYDVAVILFLLVCKKSVNLGRFVFDRMVQHAEVPQGNTALPFACLISRFLEDLPCFEPPPLTKLPVALFKYSAKYHDKIFDLPAVPPRPSPVDPTADCTTSTVPGSSPPSSSAVPPPSAQPSSLAELVARLQVAYASYARLRAEQSALEIQIQDLHSSIFALLSGSPPM